MNKSETTSSNVCRATAHKLTRSFVSEKLLAAQCQHSKHGRTNYILPLRQTWRPCHPGTCCNTSDASIACTSPPQCRCSQSEPFAIGTQNTQASNIVDYPHESSTHARTFSMTRVPPDDCTNDSIVSFPVRSSSASAPLCWFRLAPRDMLVLNSFEKPESVLLIIHHGHRHVHSHSHTQTHEL